MTPIPKSLRGFAAMDPERQREIARKGGKTTPAEKRAFAVNPCLAKAAGYLGGKSVDPAKRAFATNRELAAEAGRKGGSARRRGAGP